MGTTGIPEFVDVRELARASRMSARLDVPGGRILVTAPVGTPMPKLLGFLERNAEWMRKAMAAVPAAAPFAPGAVLPVFGRDRVVRLAGEGAAGEGDIVVRDAATAAAEVRRAVAAEVEARLGAFARDRAASVGLAPRSVRAANLRAKWGCCKGGRDIALSWRLAFAPPEIGEYVAAHEVAHLAEMNHHARFWRLCARLSPIPPEEAERWLARNWASLMRYGSNARA